MTVGVYEIRHVESGKRYIGSSIHVKKRLKAHRKMLRNGNHHSPHLQNAWNLYGKDAFQFSVLEECSKKILLEVEQRWLDETKVYLPENGYNISRDAIAVMTGRTHTEETKRKISEAKALYYEDNPGSMLGRTHSDETKALISEISKERWQNQDHPMLGKPRSEECIKKIKATKLKQKLEDPEGFNSHRRGVSLTSEQNQALQKAREDWFKHNNHPMLGKKHTEESKQKMSESKKGQPAWNKGIPLTEETKLKLSASLKGREISAYCRQRISETHRGEGNSQAKLTKDQVFDILDEYSKGGISQAKLGLKYGVSQAQIFHIVKGKSWRHVYDTFHAKD